MMTPAESPSPETPPVSRIGEQLIASGQLTRDQVGQILALQAEQRLRFGEAAIRLGYLRPEQVQQILSEQFGYATSLSGSEDALAVPLAITHAPFSQEAEAIRQIRANLASFQDDDGSLCFAVVSPAEGEGKSYLAASLAVAFAQTGQTTLLINANLRPSGQPEPLRPRDHNNPTGLSTVLSGRTSQLPVRTVPGYPQLAVLDAGPTPPNPLEILADPALRNLLGTLRQQYHIIILDTPPARASSDALVIARQTRLAIMVGRRDLTRLDHLQQVQRELTGHGVTLLGTVYNTFALPDTTSRLPSPGVLARLRQRVLAWRRRLLRR